MFGTLFVFSFMVVITILITQDAMSTPQIGIQIADTINNNDTGGGNVKQPQAELTNSTAIPGSGYPGDYYEQHSNESSPTSPSLSGGSVNLENSTFAPSPCASNNQIANTQEDTPTDAQATGSGDSIGAANDVKSIK